MEFCKKILKKIKLFVLFWTRIFFVRNNFKVPFFIKLKCNFCGGYLADQYILYDLKHNDKKDFLSELDWYKSRYINEPFDFAFNNKVICSEILEKYIQVPKNHFIKNKGIIYDFKSGVKNEADIICFLEHQKKLFLKPFALGKGNGVHMLSFFQSTFFLDNQVISRVSLMEFLNHREDYIICEYMQQHSYAEHLYSQTVNTIRFITMRNTKSHEFEAFYAVQRIGRKMTIPVDNGSKGGLVSRIDLDEGTLSAAKSLHDLNEYQYHPESGSCIEGIRIPGWSQIKLQILEVCKKIPYMDFIAWDLLVTDQGVCVIEANSSSGVNIIQLWGGQKNGVLGDFFKHNKII